MSESAEQSALDRRWSSRLAGFAETVVILVGVSLLAAQIAASTGVPNRSVRDSLVFGDGGPDWGAASVAETEWLLLRYGLTFAAVLAVCAWRGAPVAAPRLDAERRTPAALIGFGIALCFAGLLPMWAAKSVHAVYPLGANTPMWDVMNASPWTREFWLFMAASSFGIIPLVEEFYFRGYALARYRENFSAGGAVALSAIFFWVAHGQYIQSDPYLIFNSALTLYFALLLGWATVQTGSLIPAIVCHMLVNVPVDLAGTLAGAVAGIAIIVLRTRAVVSAARDFLGLIASTREWLFLIAVAGGLLALAITIRGNPSLTLPVAAVFVAVASLGLLRRAAPNAVRTSS
jgi:membrane protease YdiL (CAAX protease family)